MGINFSKVDIRFFRLLIVIAVICLCTLAGCASRKADPATEAIASEQASHEVPPSSKSVYPDRATTDAVAAIEAQKNNGSSLDDYDLPEKPSIYDPIEPWNRFWFNFNDFFYLKVAKPIYTGYEYVTPRQVRSGLKNFLANTLFPVRFVNSLLQGKFRAAGVEFGRFVINTVVGMGGFIDAANGVKAVVDVDPSGEDFGQTLGYWGVGHGFYIVWPFIGPSSVRETVGLATDQFFHPLYYLGNDITFWVGGGLRFNSIDDILLAYENLNKSAVDPYVATREAYIQLRNARVKQ